MRGNRDIGRATLPHSFFRSGPFAPSRQLTHTRLHAVAILEAQVAQLPPNAGGGFMPRIGQHYPVGQSRVLRRPDLAQRNLGLGLEPGLLRHIGLPPPGPLIPPPARQSQEVTCRQTRSPSRHRQQHCHLELVLLAPLPTLLARHGESVPALFRKDSVVDNPGHNRLAESHHRRHLTLDGVQQSLVAPKRPGQKVMYRVPRCPHPARVETRILEPDRFALARRQRSSAIVFKWKLAGPDARAVHSAGPLTPPGRAHLDVFAWDGRFVRNDCTSLSTVDHPKAAAGRCAGSG